MLSNALEAEQRLDGQIREQRDTLMALNSGRARTTNVTETIQRLQTQLRELESRRHRSTGGPPPTPTWISIALGSAYFRTGAMADAEREYREAVYVDGSLGEGHNNLSVIYMLTGRFDDAEAALRLAEQSGFRVNPQLKEDLKKRREAGGGRRE
jgi:tetratricopeptide (TPR) repeat protein